MPKKWSELFNLENTDERLVEFFSKDVRTPFFTTKAKGMGLGLLICKRIIEAHGGKIFVESIVGEGTTFAVTIPVESKPKEKGGGKI